MGQRNKKSWKESWEDAKPELFLLAQMIDHLCRQIMRVGAFDLLSLLVAVGVTMNVGHLSISLWKFPQVQTFLHWLFLISLIITCCLFVEIIWKNSKE